MAASRDRSAPDDRRLRFAPASQRALQAGIATLERVLGPTLGPHGHAVAIGRIGRPGEPPEVLSDGGVIARRLTGLAEPFANMGLMLARNAAWRMRRAHGDGTATTVALLAATHRALVAAAAAGAEPVALRRGVERAVERAALHLMTQATPLPGDEVERFVAATTGDRAVVAGVAEALALLGPEAVIVARESRGRGVDLECIEGALWESPAITMPLLSDTPSREVRLLHPRVLLWDAAIEEPAPLARALDLLRAVGTTSLLIVARSFARPVVALLRAARVAGIEVVAVTPPHEGPQQEWALADLAALSGARLLAPVCGDCLDRLDLAAVGTAQRVVAGPGVLNLLTTATEPAAIARQRSAVLHLLDETDDEQEVRRLTLRLGRLRQGMGVLWVGAATERERGVRLRAAEQALGRVRAAMQGGIVTGGGTAYLAAARGLACAAEDETAALGARAVAVGLEAPARWIARNAGLDPTWAIERARPEAPARGIDALTGQIRDLRAAGIVDPACAAVQALRIAGATAALATSCDVLVRRPIPLHLAELRP